MYLYCLSLSLMLILITHTHAAGKKFYTAAVYEHALNFTPIEVADRNASLIIMDFNLETLEKEVMKASMEMADIFVFPEYGLSGALADRTTAGYFAEDVPDPSNIPSFCPCLKSSVQAGQEVLHRLSCIAQNNSIYLAINMADKKLCSVSDIHCPSNGQYQYDTEVVFDRRGCLIARYHKENLFGLEKAKWDSPKVDKHSFFDTEFGRFGLMICFDAVFRKPGIELVETYNVTDIIFSTEWRNNFPYYASVAYHSGWARNMKVNFLSANIHDISNNLVGSGIYGPDGVIAYTFNMTTKYGTLLIAQVPIIKKPITSTGSVFSFSTPSTQGQTFKLPIAGDVFTFRAIEGYSGIISVCDQEVCCTVEFSRSNTSQKYAIGAYDGMHVLDGAIYLEVCLFVRCLNNYSDCGSALGNETNTDFQSYSLVGTMPTKYVFPEVVASDFNFTTDWDFYNDGTIKRINGTNKNIYSVILWGRNFYKDPAVSLLYSYMTQACWSFANMLRSLSQSILNYF